MKKPSKITFHQNELDTYGVEVLPMTKLDDSVQDAHRDDHYMLILLQKGTIEIEIDFHPVIFKGPSLCIVTPGQVHRYLQRKNIAGYFLFIDTKFVTNQYREIFATYEHIRQVAAIHKEDMLFASTLILAQLLSQQEHALSKSLIASQTNTILGITAAHIIQSQSAHYPLSGQRYNIVKQFKQCISTHYKTMKQVQDYAAMLNITPLYLNEVIKEMTGYPASFWIQQEIVLEAQRMLVYTSQDVKQIAWELGYEDPTYFSRFFKKNTGMTALAFRAENHGLSNHSH